MPSVYCLLHWEGTEPAVTDSKPLAEEATEAPDVEGGEKTGDWQYAIGYIYIYIYIFMCGIV